mmetsp:Transcript_16152/g.44748  ORF Transcript_16152/g.44748 Transcript_16152/m.44748 type:complete len:119 (-) Transcript_16152:113-469(-)
MGYLPTSYTAAMARGGNANTQPLTAMVQVLLEELRPYYSQEQLKSESFGYTALSLVALSSLQCTISTQQLSMALQTTDTVERLEWILEWMQEHSNGLQEIAESRKQELLDCGERTDDL